MAGAQKPKKSTVGAPDDYGPRPLLRGVLHQYACAAALGAGVMLVVTAPTAHAAYACTVYAASLVILFGASAAYHRSRVQFASTRLWLQHLDHSAIFTLIAGTYTPVCMLALQDPARKGLLTIVWSAAAAGIVKNFAFPNAPKLVSSLAYLAMGWSAVPYRAQLLEGMGWPSAALMLAGGIAYSLGAVVYVAGRPDPVPHIFGYHEIFHVLTIIATMFHFTSVYKLAASST